jgi:hypothetical protein
MDAGDDRRRDADPARLFADRVATGIETGIIEVTRGKGSDPSGPPWARIEGSEDAGGTPDPAGGPRG